MQLVVKKRMWVMDKENLENQLSEIQANIIDVNAALLAATNIADGIACNPAFKSEFEQVVGILHTSYTAQETTAIKLEKIINSLGGD